MVWNSTVLRCTNCGHQAMIDALPVRGAEYYCPICLHGISDGPKPEIVVVGDLNGDHFWPVYIGGEAGGA